MKIAVINETSAADRNADILTALDGLGHEVFNVGMKRNGEKPELTYIHTGFLGALLLNTSRVDFVVGGCGTGQGFLSSVMQYPGVFCGHLMSPLDAWLFTQINAGNCISLALNQGYGWAGNINLKFLFEKLFGVERGGGFPPHRRESQQQSRLLLAEINRETHRSFAECVSALPDTVIKPALEYPGVLDVLDCESIENWELKHAIVRRLK